MTRDIWSQSALQTQFDAVAGLFSDTAWVSWVFNVQRVTTVAEGRWWWKKSREVSSYEDVEWPRTEVPVIREETRLLFDLPPEMLSFTTDYTGHVLGVNIYANKHDEEPIMRTGFRGDNYLVPGTRVDIVPPVYMDVEGL